MTWRAAFFALLLAAALALAPAARAGQDDPRLNALFAALQTTEDANEGDRLGRRIARIWGMSGDPEVDQLMSLGGRLLRNDQLGRALETYKEVTALAPEFAEGWNKRAHVRYLLGDFKIATRHIRRVLGLEPRHFLAMAGLGLIYLEMGRERAALAVFERALAINPYLFGVKRTVDQLNRKLGNEKT